MGRKLVYFAILAFSGAFGIGLFLMIAMPYLFPIFSDEKLIVRVTNLSAKQISVVVEVTDLDSNKSEIRAMPGLESVLQNQVASAELSLDGFAPESCSKILIRAEGLEKAFECGPREKISGLYQTTAEITFTE